MSDCHHRPTLTFPGGAYNATQVRLYGIIQDTSVLSTGEPRESKIVGGNVTVKTTLKSDNPHSNDADLEVKRLRKDNKLSEEEIYRRIIEKYGTEIGFPPILYRSQILIDTKQAFGYVSIMSLRLSKDRGVSCGIIVGYSYEGHCYDLPKPKIMLLPTVPCPIPEDDCGYSEKYNSKTRDKYVLWIVDKLDECVEFEMNQGFVEQLVLEANLPGKRSPTMYAARQALGHRSGRLTE
ncbi:MAG: hypothetical protein E5V92_03145 [Mesorhizobium sp.]|uniref:hypothetical protein n=1 Tax=unclassified Mesorhizobium TaxID=325217 RepID=UPI000F756B26|nr:MULTISPECIES: hypothetical protein [unclassified Mesorhizobium]AZO74455.1 hypothetical protein EJ067_27345 [Mesorhizobium sp. M1D.F.Ca.ET.043.01.1.1]RWA96677.1 MAG: hypothetical protein EOQ32_03515 [Mesorhizobium sp.]RWE18227.1 MAG: hypothetical protein EOS61_00275 [Mesorhizobium sp.]TJW89632.1 MAG: hypothetical protein E5V92_03145 [Mesorhizobium sp.]